MTLTRRFVVAQKVPGTLSSSAGFTLIELSIVVLIIGLVSALAIPRLRSVTGAELAATTRRLAHATRYLYEEAALRGNVLSLILDLDRQQYWVAKLDDLTGELVEDGSLLSRRVALPDGIRIADVVLPGVGKLAGGLAPTRFYPEGYADGSVIHLVDGYGHAYTVRIDPIRGRGVVLEGYHDFDTAS
ncbi:MAG: pilus assembly FimT family protein [Vicinamibacterales bacterium]